MNIFDMESPFQKFLNRMTDLLILNLITVLCCLPVITAGASVTAMHFVLLKMVRGQEGYVLQDFRRSFKRNFRQSTIMWIAMLLYGLFAGWNLAAMMSGAERAPVWIIALLAVSVLVDYFLALFAFPLQSRYDNPVRETLLNALMLIFGRLLLTLEMAVITAFPAVLVYLAAPLFPLIALFGLSVPGYACAMLYSPLFDRIEGRRAESDDNDENAE